MPSMHPVAGNDSIGSIAERYGHYAALLWRHARNAALRQQGRDPTALLPGDRVFVPDLVLKRLRIATGRRHTFVRKGVPGVFRLRIMVNGQARRAEAYSLEVDGRALCEGATDADGWLEAFVPLDARTGVLHLAALGMSHTLAFGMLVPASEWQGQVQRLDNLGFLADPARWRKAVRAFQQDASLPQTGMLDPDTVASIDRAHAGGMP